jgi:hypothetical protein
MSTPLIQPKTVDIKDRDGNIKQFVISRLPAVASRYIMANYPVSNIPKLGEYKASEEAMLKLMGYVAVVVEGREDPLRLSNIDLINNHVPDGESLLRIEFAMLEYNYSFFGQGGLSSFLTGLIETHLPKIISTLMASLPPSLVRDLQAGPNSKPQST